MAMPARCVKINAIFFILRFSMDVRKSNGISRQDRLRRKHGMRKVTSDDDFRVPTFRVTVVEETRKERTRFLRS